MSIHCRVRKACEQVQLAPEWIRYLCLLSLRIKQNLAYLRVAAECSRQQLP